MAVFIPGGLIRSLSHVKLCRDFIVAFRLFIVLVLAVTKYIEKCFASLLTKLTEPGISYYELYNTVLSISIIMGCLRLK